MASLFEFGRSGFLRWLHWFFFNEISVVVMGRKWIMTGYKKSADGGLFFESLFFEPLLSLY